MVLMAQKVEPEKVEEPLKFVETLKERGLVISFHDVKVAQNGPALVIKLKCGHEATTDLLNALLADFNSGIGRLSPEPRGWSQTCPQHGCGKRTQFTVQIRRDPETVNAEDRQLADWQRRMRDFNNQLEALRKDVLEESNAVGIAGQLDTLTLETVLRTLVLYERIKSKEAQQK